MKGILRILEYISGLKVNFHKSNLHGMFLEESFIVRAERVTNCNISALPMSCLGMKIGGNSHRKNEWKELAQKLKSRIMKWDNSSISLAGRATLIQSVLSAMPINQLSLFLLPKSVIKDLTTIQRNFLWGGTKNFRKTPWVRWGWVCQKKSEGGLGIRELGIYNKALLHKWVWRILRERESLWVKILESKYGRLETLDIEGMRRKSNIIGYVWWIDLMAIYWGNSGDGAKIDFIKIVGKEIIPIFGMRTGLERGC
ncbi:hypothetical protein ACS0TY_023781 [Phlomoides rotata]